jgi:hypothetical protein
MEKGTGISGFPMKILTAKHLRDRATLVAMRLAASPFGDGVCVPAVGPGRSRT